ncbi:serine palmitoyltransferase small subunit A-like [Ctenocephalides felis]|uniref:serine palmitoyltransferase small subunit A-like n=1 Tax=Ctenocephalides felis TaxID=7515 RepID=UPI000E6E3283|nr:serine palmitoyltransferase small subunit A-like [Ctenocephalides felis]XP_026477680.1 serine palmitoyltransferase small subunit A-like [Ctenocephalides felis]
MFEPITEFISYWYFRYLLVTELYMVEKWERVSIHIFFVIVFAALSYFNNNVFVPMSSKMFNFAPDLADLIPVAS